MVIGECGRYVSFKEQGLFWRSSPFLYNETY